MSASHWFSKSYTEAKKRFNESVNQLESLGHQVQRDSLSLDLVGPDGEDLTIDIAVLGSLTSNKLLLYTSGIHGVEGFAGSAIQLSVIDMLKNQKLIEDYCIIFVHIINPFGMAWHRRVNENNVDMNRNFINTHSGEPDGYKKIDKFLNPNTIPKKFELSFYIDGIKLILKYGFTNFKQWFAQGQYTRPSSLQYGGDKLQKGPKLLIDWLRKNLKETQMIFGIDLHTGLGKSGYDTILISDQIGKADYELLQNLYGSHIAPLDPNKGVGYHVTGDIHSGISAEFPSIKWLTITQEFGTYGPVTVFKNLRAENRWTQNNKLNDPLDIMKHWSRNNLLRTFNPDSRKWHESLIVRGKTVFNKAVEYLISID